MNLIKGLFKHIFLLITFRHNGTGLKVGSGFFALLLIINSMVNYFNSYGDEQFTLGSYIFSNLFIAGIYLFCFKKINSDMTTGALLIIISLEFIQYLTGFKQSTNLMLLFLCWEVFAVFHMAKNVRGHMDKEGK